MPKVDLRVAEMEREEDASILCKTCNASADDEYEPYCMSCGIYWKEVKNGLFDD